MPCEQHPESSHLDCLDCMALDWTPYIEDEGDEAPTIIPTPSPDADNDGWLDGVPVIRAKFYGRRFKPGEVTSIVCHCGSSDRFTFGRYFQNPRALKDGKLVYRHVSTHCGISDEGAIEQYVPYTNASWNCGVANFSTMSFEGQGPHTRKDRPQAFYDSLKWLVDQWLVLYPTITTVYSHRYLCPRTRRDPGPGLDWTLFEERDLVVQP